MQKDAKFVRIQVEKVQASLEDPKLLKKSVYIKSLFQKKRSLSDSEKKVRDKYLMDKLIKFNSKYKTKHNIEPKINFQRGLEPERIINEFILLGDYLMAMVKWKNTTIVDPVIYEDLKEKYPQIVLNFFQSKMTTRRSRTQQLKALRQKSSENKGKKSS